MTVEDNNFIIKNGLSVGTGKHQILDSSGRLTANYVTLNTGGRYLSAGVDLWDLFSNAGIPPLSTFRWNETYERVSNYGPIWDDVHSYVHSESATNNTDYNRSTFVNVSGDSIYGDVEIDGDVYLQKHLRVDGHTYLSGAQYIENDSYVMGDLRVDGNVELGVESVNPKSIYFGATNDDRVVFRADVDSNIIPNDNISYDLGTSTQQWRELFVQDISATNDVFVDNDLLVSANGTIGADFRVSGHTIISGNTVLSGTLDIDDATYIYDTLDVELDTHIHSDLFVSDNTTISGNTTLSGTLDVKDFTTLHNDLSVKGDLFVDGNAYLSAGVDGVINVGDTNTDSVVFRADIDSNIIPDDDITFDLGTSTQRWRELFVQDISATNDVFVDNDLLVSANGTVGEDFRVSGAVVVGGYTELSGTLDVEQDTTIHGHVSAVSGMSLIGDLTASDSVFIKGNIYVEGHSYFGFGLGTQSKLNLGDANVDEVVFQADVGSDIIPHPSRTYNLGAPAKRWNTLYIGRIDAYDKIYTSSDFETKGNVIQKRDIGVGKTIESIEQIWRGENGSNTVANVETATFDSKYQSVKYTILVSTDTSVSTINADFIRNGTTVNGTTYGNVNVGITEPLKSVDCGIVNSKFYLILSVERYAKVMITGKAMFLS